MSIVTTVAQRCVLQVTKYMDASSGALANQIRILDPRQRASFPDSAVEQFPDIFDLDIRMKIDDGSDGCEYRRFLRCAPRPEDVPLLQWWEDVASLFPNMAVVANKYLRLPLTSVCVESTFSLYGTTRSKNQFAMEDEVHSSRISFVFNGQAME